MSLVSCPIAVDTLTAENMWLNFDHVCILINKLFPLMDEILVYITGDKIALKVLYVWKHVPCSYYGLIVQPPNLCPTSPMPQTVTNNPPRGKCTSRKTKSTCYQVSS
ncbi:hypothetical protein KFK09_007151 [Dendrobium nobile]|uniref:Uncharacterized protein n=1 Tax=Dendrobium nobile TaxID=94219 RepID=A0A8T3BWA9_DENNO|nr:hypothetical protein KFK09_007151 [Dendrobium nobile]